MHRILRLLVLAACVATPVAALADNITILPEYNGTGSYPDPGPYQPSTVVGMFTIDPGATGISIFGSFGNSMSPNTAGLDLYLGTLLVGQCVEFTTCYSSLTPTAWGITLTPAQIAALGTGIIDFTVVQTSQYTIRLGETTLVESTTSPVPEPSTMLLMATGSLAAMGSLRRRFNS